MGQCFAEAPNFVGSFSEVKLPAFIPARYHDRISSVLKFGVSSGLASAIDFGVFALLTKVILVIDNLFYVDMIAASCGMIVNFFIHKTFVFDLQRKTYAAFLMSISFSIIVMVSGAKTMEYIGEQAMVADSLLLLYAAKIGVMGVKFIINFFSKRWVFERKVFKA